MNSHHYGAAGDGVTDSYARYGGASIYEPSAGDRLLADAPARRRRRLIKPASIVVALATIAAGVTAYMVASNAAAAPNPNCTLIVPANPLSAAGLATPYQLTATNADNGP